MVTLLIQFGYLQALDLLTTLAFLTIGVKEANPLVRLLIETLHSPLGGVAAAKGIAVLLAVCCLWARKPRALQRVNVFYAAVVAWNLVAFLVSTRAGGAV